MDVCLWVISVVCFCSVSLQVIQTIRATDRDNFANGRFSFALPADGPTNPNFTVKDNEGTKPSNLRVHCAELWSVYSFSKRFKGYAGSIPRTSLPIMLIPNHQPVLLYHTNVPNQAR